MAVARVIITGVGGFIGAHVARRFLAEGFAVTGVDDLSNGLRANIPPGVDFVEADLAERGTLAQLPRDCQAILHLGGQSSGEVSFDDPVADLQKNTVSTLNLVRHGLEIRVPRLVYASSMSVYGSVPDAPVAETQPCAPLSCYGVGKFAAENYLRVYARQLPFVAMRMFNVYGPGQDLSNLRQGMVSIYLAQALRDGRIEVKGSLERFRDCIFIDDVVEAWFRATTRDAALGQTLNIGTGVRTSVRELLTRICELVPGSVYEIVGGTPGDQSGIYADNGLLRRTLGLERFTTLADGLSTFVKWARTASRGAKVNT